MVTNSSSLSQLIRQVAVAPNSVMKPQVDGPMLQANPAASLSTHLGFAGVRQSVTSDDFVGSGLHLSLTLSSGQDITLNIEKSVGGGLKDVRLQTSGVLNVDDEEKLEQFLTELSQSVDAIFLGEAGRDGLFDFANMKGVNDVALTIQQDKGNLKQRLEFEKQHTEYGRKEVEGEWSRYNHLTGEQEQHNFALSKQPRDVTTAYGQMDYQWVVDQVSAGMGVLGNAHTGDSSTQTRVTDFFVSAIHSLFNESQKGHQLLQSLGASAHASKALIGQTIRGLSDQSVSANNMPGTVMQQGHDEAQKMNGLADFKADFSSKRDTQGRVNANGEYNLSMSISQVSRTLQGATQDDSSQTQFRRLLLKYESQGQKQEYEYNWKHDDILINRFTNGALEQTYFKLTDLQQGILSTHNGRREEVSEFMQRKEYLANNQNTPTIQNSYTKPNVYTEQVHNVNYTV